MSNLSLRAVIGGMRKHARQQHRRETHTHYGLAGGSRSVADVSAEELPIPAREERSFEEQGMRRRQRRIVLAQIFEFTRNRDYRSLLWRRLFRGESIEDLARNQGLNPSTAHRVVRKARKYLGIKR
ncbi:MAG: hypothetical protein SFV23_16875 [Planctomycetaceae bacterium]|nr:hypothetical protein [Planctomycetaceae bacterium]